MGSDNRKHYKSIPLYTGSYFKVKIEDFNGIEHIENFSKISGLQLDIESTEKAAPGANVTKVSPGKLNYQKITCIRPLGPADEDRFEEVGDDNVEFSGTNEGNDNAFLYNWLQEVNNFLIAKNHSKEDYRKKVVIFIYCDLSKPPIRKIRVKNAWPESYGISELDANASKVLTEKLVLNHEGWTFV